MTKRLNVTLTDTTADAVARWADRHKLPRASVMAAAIVVAFDHPEELKQAVATLHGLTPAPPEPF